MSLHQEEIENSLEGIDNDIIDAVGDLDDAIADNVKCHSLGSNYDKKRGLITIEFIFEAKK